MTNRRTELAEVHRRVLQEDPTASLTLFLLLHKPLIRVLQRQFGRGLELEQIMDLATDAIMAYLREPRRFDPQRSSLYSYLAMIARGDGLNRLQSKKSEQKKLRLYSQEVVELDSPARNMQKEAETTWDATTLLEKYGKEIVEDEVDGAVLRLILLGEKDTAAYARAINVAHLPEDERKAAVKQRRDRIEKRLVRLKGRL